MEKSDQLFVSDMDVSMYISHLKWRLVYQINYTGGKANLIRACCFEKQASLSLLLN